MFLMLEDVAMTHILVSARLRGLSGVGTTESGIMGATASTAVRISGMLNVMMTRVTVLGCIFTVSFQPRSVGSGGTAAPEGTKSGPVYAAASNG